MKLTFVPKSIYICFSILGMLSAITAVTIPDPEPAVGDAIGFTPGI